MAIKMKDLPSEVLQEIFSWLDGVTLFEVLPFVCKRFRSLAKKTEPQLFILAPANAGKIRIRDSFVEIYHLLEENLYLRHLQIQKTEFHSETDFSTIARILRNQSGLKSIRLESKIPSLVNDPFEVEQRLKEAIYNRKYLVELEVANLGSLPPDAETSVAGFRLTYPKAKQNHCLPWTEPEIRALLQSWTEEAVIAHGHSCCHECDLE